MIFIHKFYVLSSDSIYCLTNSVHELLFLFFLDHFLVINVHEQQFCFYLSNKKIYFLNFQAPITKTRLFKYIENFTTKKK